MPLEDAARTLKLAKNKSLAEIDELIQKDREAAGYLRDMFNFFEEMALGIKLNYVDESVACELFHLTANRYYATLSEWVVHYRTSKEVPEFYTHYEWLNKRWADGCVRARAE